MNKKTKVVYARKSNTISLKKKAIEPKATLLLTYNDEIDEINTYNERNISDEEKSIKQRLKNTENYADTGTGDIFKTNNRYSNKNNNVLLLINKHDINTCNYYKDNIKQHKEKYSEQSIEYDENKINAIANVENESLTRKTNTNTNTDNKYDNVSNICD